MRSRCPQIGECFFSFCLDLDLWIAHASDSSDCCKFFFLFLSGWFGDLFLDLAPRVKVRYGCGFSRFFSAESEMISGLVEFVVTGLVSS